jgi:hypothetical protein
VAKPGRASGDELARYLQTKKLHRPSERKRLIETARELGIPGTEAAQERAFGKVALKKSKKKPRHKWPTR